MAYFFEPHRIFWKKATFRQTVSGWIHKEPWFPFSRYVDFWPKILQFRTQTACFAISKCSLIHLFQGDIKSVCLLTCVITFLVKRSIDKVNPVIFGVKTDAGDGRHYNCHTKGNRSKKHDDMVGLKKKFQFQTFSGKGNKWYFVTKIVLNCFEKNFWNSRLKAKILQNFWDQ